jgi:hypothetical protein
MVPGYLTICKTSKPTAEFSIVNCTFSPGHIYLPVEMNEDGNHSIFINLRCVNIFDLIDCSTFRAFSSQNEDARSQMMSYTREVFMRNRHPPMTYHTTQCHTDTDVSRTARLSHRRNNGRKSYSVTVKQHVRA